MRRRSSREPTVWMVAASREGAELDADSVEGDYRRNFAAGLVHGVFFQAAAAFSSIHTVLPAFVSLLTGSTFAVGLMASVQGIGQVVPQLFTAYFIEGRQRKKPTLLAIITLRWVSWAVLAWLTLRFGASHPGLVLIVLLVLFAGFSIAGGAGTVVYADVFAKAIPADRRGRFVGWKQLLGYGLAIGAGWLVKWIVSDESGLAFPASYSLIFLLTSLSLMAAMAGFAMIREPIALARRASTSLPQLLVRARHLARTNRNFRRTLWARGLTDAGIALGPFYVVYGLSNGAVGPSVIGTYLAVQMAGSALSNVLWGSLADRFGNRSVIIGTTIAGFLTPMAALIALVAPGAFIAVFAGLGITISGLRLGFDNLILEMADVELRPTCVALQNTLLAPVALMPLLVAGLFTWVAFQTLLALGGAVMLLAIVAAFRIVDPRTDPHGECLESTNPAVAASPEGDRGFS